MRSRSRGLRRRVGAIAAVAVLVVLGMQLLPYGRDHNNPPMRAEPQWNSAQTRALAVRACFDCHSNQTEWPWYSQVAPTSWLIQRDVVDGRKKVNFSEWDRSQPEARDSAEQMALGRMPPSHYTILKPSANLGDPEWRALVDGLRATFPEFRDERN
jgi:hypothetical protein